MGVAPDEPILPSLTATGQRLEAGTSLNPRLAIRHVLATNFDGRSQLAKDVRRTLSSDWPDEYLGEISATVRVGEAKAQRVSARGNPLHGNTLEMRCGQFQKYHPQRTNVDGLDHTDALRTPWYDTLRPYLAEDVRARLEKPRTTYISLETGRPPARSMFSGEVDRIERREPVCAPTQFASGKNSL